MNKERRKHWERVLKCSDKIVCVIDPKKEMLSNDIDWDAIPGIISDFVDTEKKEARQQGKIEGRDEMELEMKIKEIEETLWCECGHSRDNHEEDEFQECDILDCECHGFEYDYETTLKMQRKRIKELKNKGDKK